MDDDIRQVLLDAGLRLSKADEDFFERLLDCVVRGNRRMNLTRLTEPPDFWVKHVLDAALPFLAVPALADLPPQMLVADLGAGAGFPGFVLARLYPGWDVALLERTRKKAEFLEETIQELQIANAYVVPYDAAEAPRQAPVLDRGCHLVVARAVGRIGKVTKAAAPLLAPGGLVVHYKGGRPDPDELAEARRVAASLRFDLGEPLPYTLPPGTGRSVVLAQAPRRRRKPGRKRRRRAG